MWVLILRTGNVQILQDAALLNKSVCAFETPFTLAINMRALKFQYCTQDEHLLMSKKKIYEINTYVYDCNLNVQA